MEKTSISYSNPIQRFLLSSNNIEKNSYVWNMLGSTLNAFQSVVILMILTRTVGLAQSGVFTIAFANANLFLYLGNYGMRNFQVSDVKMKYSFVEYLCSRLYSVSAMLFVAISFILISAITNNYSPDKICIMMLMVLQKVVDALENVFHGEYQRNDRLDVAGRCMTIRMIILVVTLGITVAFTKNLLYGLIVSTLINAIVFCLFTAWTNNQYTNKGTKSFSRDSLKSLMWHCLPLCIGTFLSFYIGNAPKYAIDAQLSAEEQACYGFIAMPVFVVGLLNNYIFMPQLHALSIMWESANIKGFIKKVLFQVGILSLITIGCLVGAFLLGIPVLSFIFNTDLSAYKMPLLVLLLGGGFLGFTGFLNAVITILRYQKYTLIGYAFVSLVALCLSSRIVFLHGIVGASILYALLMFVLSLIFAVILAVGVGRRKT